MLRAVFSALAMFFVASLVVMAGYECSTYHQGVAPFACPLLDVVLRDGPAADRTTETLTVMFWIAAIVATCFVGYGFAQLAYPAAWLAVALGALPYVLVVVAGIRGAVWGLDTGQHAGTEAVREGISHAWVLGYVFLLFVHFIAGHLGAKASADDA